LDLVADASTRAYEDNLEAPGETGETPSPLAAFLAHAALEAGDNMAQAGQDAIQLMTVHSAKGLEFDCVFITGMEEGLFPHENAMSDRDGLEEERRLMYVAITRARARLYLSHSQTRMLHGQTRFNLKSRFFDELPEVCLKWLTPKRQPATSAYALGGAGRAWSDDGGYGSGGYGRSGASHGSGYSYGGASSAYNSARVGQGDSASPSQRSADAPVPRKDASSHGLQVRQKVFHGKFGEGTVLTLEGAGDDARAQISFARHGTKWLALSVAKLTPVP
jgi:DNA helicase-2/ATP-dependent DNA helicase PcrA